MPAVLHNWIYIGSNAYDEYTFVPWLNKNRQFMIAVDFVAGSHLGYASVACEHPVLGQHGGKPEQVDSVSVNMSPAFIKGVTEHLPIARLTFDKFHVVAHASNALEGRICKLNRDLFMRIY